MPANFTEEQKREIREKLIAIGYGLIRELGLKKMKVSLIAERADIATGTFYHFFDSKEAYIAALIAEQDRVQGEQLQMLLAKGDGKLTLEQAIRWFRDSFRTENNILMELTLDDWVWLKSHQAKMGMFNETQAMQEAMQYLAYVDGIRSDLDIRVIINFFKTIYSMAQNRETFIQDVFETNIDMIFACIYHYVAAPK